MSNHSLTAIRVVIAGLITNDHNTKGVTAMNENLKKILSASIDGYIYHSDEAERIVSDLTKLTVTEIDPMNNSYILDNVEAYLEFLELKDMDKEAVTCGEYVGILDSFVKDPGADDVEDRQLVIRQASTIINNCDHLLYLGTQDIKTAEFISYRAFKTPENVLCMPLSRAILITKGEKAAVVNKIRPYSTMNPNISRLKDEVKKEEKEAV